MKDTIDKKEKAIKDLNNFNTRQKNMYNTKTQQLINLKEKIRNYGEEEIKQKKEIKKLNTALDEVIKENQELNKDLDILENENKEYSDTIEQLKKKQGEIDKELAGRRHVRRWIPDEYMTYALTWELFLKLEKISENSFFQTKVWEEFKE